MNIDDFAKTYKLRKPKRDECDDLNITGKRGTIYYNHDNIHFVATTIGAPTAQHWNKYREAAKKLGCKITQNGDTEGSFIFVPWNIPQVKLAIEMTQAYKKRQLTDEQRKASAERLLKARSFRLGTQRKQEGEV